MVGRNSIAQLARIAVGLKKLARISMPRPLNRCSSLPPLKKMDYSKFATSFGIVVSSLPVPKMVEDTRRRWNMSAVRRK